MMYGFKNDNGIGLYRGEALLFGGLRPYARTDSGKVLYTEPVSVEGTSATFTSPAGVTIVLSVTETEEGVFTLRLKGDYIPDRRDPDGARDKHLHPEDGYGVEIAEIGGMTKWLANYRGGDEYWCRTMTDTDLSKMPQRTQHLLWKTEAEYGFVTPVCDKEYKTDLVGCEKGGFQVTAWSNTILNHCDTVALIGGFGENLYLLPEFVIGRALRILGKKGGLRKTRRYPEVFEYLGWCSWDAFHMDVTHEDLLKKAAEFREKNIPVRWFILDDMWGHVPNIDRPTMHSRELYSFEAAPERFPKGLKACLMDLKEKYDIIPGIWHPTTGYWHGIDPDGEIAAEHGDKLIRTVNGKLVHSPDTAKAFLYYNAQHSFYKDCGAEFVKVDNQGFIRCHYRDQLSIGKAAEQLHTAIEASVGLNFDGALINCMGMPTENFWNRPMSAVSRISGDFQPENRQWFIQHLLQCSYNSVFQGSVYYGDWDMWWSDDAQAAKNAVLRAMSGGPVYMSDELNRSIRDKIMPIVYEDGRLIRLETPAIPTFDCMMEDAKTNGKIYKVFNRIGDGGAVAAFNLSDGEVPVTGRVTLSDLVRDEALPYDIYCVYDFFNKTIAVLGKEDELPLTLENYDDFRLFTFVPVKNGKAAIGLSEKYMSPATLWEIGDHEYSVHEGGAFAVYSEEALDFITVNGETVPVTKKGERLYEAVLPMADKLIVKI